ncbi:hypothetical protein ACIHDR_33535 [Nocardia sp. NPDC052278]|uniref:hypothetical protein n=1 Tax=unclassified Nocardia TaxID=2637762 RepID=UPI003677469E
MHLRIWLGGKVFDYAATTVAAGNVIRDWGRRRWFTIDLIQNAVEEGLLLPRLPYERIGSRAMGRPANLDEIAA